MAENISKKDLATKIAGSEEGLSVAKAERIITSLFGIIEEEMKKGNSVAIPKFGKFEGVMKAARKARNVATGETIEVPAKRYPKFKPSSVLKENVK